MTSETSKVKAKLAALISSIDDLEDLLDPLFSQTLPETLIGLEPLQQAKLQTALPYVVYDLIFIYLKSRGVDPRTHPVIPELDRIKEYFEKINNSENPPTKRAELDKAAASRFIKHAIAQSQWKKTPAEEAQDDAQTTHVTIKVTQKMLDRAEYEKKIKEMDEIQDNEDEEVLEVFGDENNSIGKNLAGMGDNTLSNRGSTSKGKAREVLQTTQRSPSTSNKRRRPAIDPFAGFGDDLATLDIPVAPKKVRSSSNTPTVQTPQPDVQTKNKHSRDASETQPSNSTKKRDKERKRVKAKKALT